jgi:hypothetical protein
MGNAKEEYTSISCYNVEAASNALIREQNQQVYECIRRGILSQWNAARRLCPQLKLPVGDSHTGNRADERIVDAIPNYDLVNTFNSLLYANRKSPCYIVRNSRMTLLRHELNDDLANTSDGMPCSSEADSIWDY